MKQNFDGAVVGDGAVEWLMSYRNDGTARFVGLQLVRGTVEDRKGTFVLETAGDFDGTQATWKATVVPGSGTGDLEGLRGKAKFGAPKGPKATFDFDYELAYAALRRRAEPLDAHLVHGHAEVDEQVARGVGEARGTAHVRGLVRDDERREVFLREPTGPAFVVRRRRARVDDARLRARRARPRRAARRGRAPTRRAARDPLRPFLRASRSIAMSGTSPDPPPTSSAGVSAIPHEQAADRAAHFELVADHDFVVQEASRPRRRSSRSTVRSISFEPSGGDATEYERDAV